MEIGVDSFAAGTLDQGSLLPKNAALAIEKLLDRIKFADKVGLDVFGIGEHYRQEFLDSAPTLLLAAAAAQTKNIKLTSAVTVLSTADPVRIFQNFATLDLISGGRAEIVAGRGSFTESFALFGLNLSDYDALFSEKLGLLLQLRDHESITWTGKFRPALQNQSIYPRPLQPKLPIWLGVGGTPASFVRAGTLGLPLMIAIIGGETHRFRPLVDLYREAGEKAGHPRATLKVGLHSLGYVGKDSLATQNRYYPGYAETFTRIGKERGWPPVTRSHFDQQIGSKGALVIGSPEEVSEKILRHSESLGGISRFSFQMDNAGLSHQELKDAIKLIGEEVGPMVNA